jgi:hypothetical protein
MLCFYPGRYRLSEQLFEQSHPKKVHECFARISKFSAQNGTIPFVILFINNLSSLKANSDHLNHNSISFYASWIITQGEANTRRGTADFAALQAELEAQVAAAKKEAEAQLEAQIAAKLEAEAQFEAAKRQAAEELAAAKREAAEANAQREAAEKTAKASLIYTYIFFNLKYFVLSLKPHVQVAMKKIPEREIFVVS